MLFIQKVLVLFKTRLTSDASYFSSYKSPYYVRFIYHRPVAFWILLTHVQFILHPASKSSSFKLLWILLPVILCPVNSVWLCCLVESFEFVFLFHFFVLLLNKWGAFFILELFYFSIPQCLHVSALFYKSLLYFICFTCYCYVYCCFRHFREKSVAVLTRNCKCPINTGRLREDTINKIMHGLTMFP